MNFSIIIPMRNAEPYVEKCIQSVLGQTYKDLEIIIIDDYSEDKSVECVTKILNKGNIPYKVLCNDEKKGVSYSRNRGIKASSGKYIFFIDADDFIEAELLERIDEANKHFDFVFCNYDRVSAEIGESAYKGGKTGKKIYISTKEVYCR